MANKEMKARVQQKIDTSANWAKATNFVPLKGEIIVYSDTNQIKIGDGVTKVNDLKFTADKPIFYITITQDTTNNSYSADKTYSEIIEAYNNGYIIQVKYNMNASTTEFYSFKSSFDSGIAIGKLDFVYLNGYEEKIFTCTTSTTTGESWHYKESKLVPNSLTINDKPLSSNITLSASDVGALSTAGGTLTGNLIGKYLTGTWLQTTAATDKAGNFATIDSSGWIYKRTPAETLTDIGGQAKITANGMLKGDGNGGITTAVKGTDYNTEVGIVHYEDNFDDVEAAYNKCKILRCTESKAGIVTSSGYVYYTLRDRVKTSGSNSTDGTVTTTTYMFTLVKNYSLEYIKLVRKVGSKTGTTDTWSKGSSTYTPSKHASKHKTGGDDPITPSDIGAQPKITANGFLTGDGEGNISAEKPVLTVSVWLTGAPTRDETTGEYIYNFASEYNYEQITDAQRKGYMVVVYYSGNIFYYIGNNSNNELIFSNIGEDCACSRLRCTSDNKWYQGSNTLVSEEGRFPSANGRFTLPEIIQNLQTSIQEIAPYTKLCSASVPTANWQGSDPYTQSISCGYDVTRSTIANIQLSDILYDQLVTDGVTYLNIENTNGALLIKAKGGKPSIDLTLQITCTETKN